MPRDALQQIENLPTEYRQLYFVCCCGVVNKLPKENQSVGKLPTKIPSVNCGKVVGKVEGNLQSGDEIPTKFCR